MPKYKTVTCQTLYSSRSAYGELELTLISIEGGQSLEVD